MQDKHMSEKYKETNKNSNRVSACNTSPPSSKDKINANRSQMVEAKQPDGIGHMTSHSGGEGERLQKVLAQAGVASRRHAEQMILDGRVTVNGQKVQVLGTKVQTGDVITVDGRRITEAKSGYVYFLLNKPAGYITSASDPQGRKTVLDLMQGVMQRIYPVGRLDNDTTGLLLLTNDGELAYRLMHPSYGIDKTYCVEIRGPITASAMQKLRHGIELEDGLTAPAIVKLPERQGQGPLQQILITIHEGRNRQVRRMLGAVGFPVVNLRRVGFGPLSLKNELKEGEFRALSELEIQELRRSVKL